MDLWNTFWRIQKPFIITLRGSDGFCQHQTCIMGNCFQQIQRTQLKESPTIHMCIIFQIKTQVVLLMIYPIFWRSRFCYSDICCLSADVISLSLYQNCHMYNINVSIKQRNTHHPTFRVGAASLRWVWLYYYTRYIVEIWHLAILLCKIYICRLRKHRKLSLGNSISCGKVKKYNQWSVGIQQN